jgi:tRNA(fMet)-specific endonuclease VapC
MRRLKTHQAEIAISAPVWHELLFGCKKLHSSRKRDAIEQYLQSVIWPSIPILPYGYAAAEWHAAERARLGSIGITPSFIDSQIAAIAATNGLILVTNDTDFKAFQEIRIENWL